MPTLFFPDADSLRLALSAGVIPPDLARSGATAGFGPGGEIWLATESPFPADRLRALGRFGIRAFGTPRIDTPERVDDWCRLLPLRRMPPPPPAGPVLFETRPERLAVLAAELRRTGRGGFAFRVDDGPGPALLRADSPSTHTLDRVGDGPELARAYSEAAPNVWVELGWRHPLAASIRPAEGTFLLLRSPREWVGIPDAGWTRELPVLPVVASPGLRSADRPDEAPRIGGTLRLARSTEPAPAELWLLPGEPTARLGELVESTDESAFMRLDCAGYGPGGRSGLVIRRRPGVARGPVDLVAPGVEAYRRWRGDVFLPCGRALKPDVRAGEIESMLARVGRVVWLRPAGGGGFVTESLPATAFRPVLGSVAYRPGRPRRMRPAWGKGRAFEAEPFVESPAEDRTDAAERDDTPKAPRRWFDWLRGLRPAWTPDGSHESRPRGPSALDRDEAEREAGHKPMARPLPPEPGDARTVWHERRRELERRRLLALNGRAEWDPAEDWPALAALSARTGDAAGAAQAWLAAIWESLNWPEPWAWNWMLCEAEAGQVPPPDADAVASLGRWLNARPTPGSARTLAAGVVWLGSLFPTPAGSAGLVGAAQEFLTRHDRWISSRAAWLAARSLAKLSGGDVLALARARDRARERLNREGLRAELDLPGFQRHATGEAGEGSGAELARQARAWLPRQHAPVRAWVAREAASGRVAPVGPPSPGRAAVPERNSRLRPFGLDGETAATSAYADLIFAWGFARCGHHSAAADLTDRGTDALPTGDPVHRFLAAAFAFRIGQAQEGRAPEGPLPDELLARLGRPGSVSDLDRYRIDKFRQHSRIIEPDGFVDAFRVPLAAAPPVKASKRGTTSDRALATLADLADPALLSARTRHLLAGSVGEGAGAAVVRMLEACPRLDAATAGEVLRRAVEVLPAESDPRTRARMLGGAMRIAARIGHAEVVRELSGRYEAAVTGLDDEDVEALTRSAIESLGATSSREELTEVLSGTEELARLSGGANRLRGLRLLLAAAGGWFTAGKPNRAMVILDAARHRLYSANDWSPVDRTAVGLGYLEAFGRSAGQLPVGRLLGRLEEVFQRLTGVHVVGTSNSHYTLGPLKLAEAAVRAAVGCEVGLSAAASEWLSRETARVSRRIERELAESLAGRAEGGTERVVRPPAER